MADFEELKLTVNLVDDASAGLASIRNQITQLTASAGQVQTTFSGVAQSVSQVGTAASAVVPHLANTDRGLKDVTKSGEEMGRGLIQMALAARRGAGAFPELALALRETTQGFAGLRSGMASLAPEMALGVTVLGAATIGVAALGAAITACSITLFNFAREWTKLSSTADTIGTSFADLKSAIDIADKFDVAAETVIRNFNGIAQAQANLAQSNSPLRQRLQGMGMDPNTLAQLQQAESPVQFQNRLREYGKAVEQARLAQGYTAMAARSTANQLLGEFGQDPGLLDRPAQKEMTKEQRETYESVGRQSEKISEVWGEIYHDIKMIGYEIADWGLTPLVLGPLEAIKFIFESIKDAVKGIKDFFNAIWDSTPEWFKKWANWASEGSPGLGSKVTPLPGYENWGSKEPKNLFRGEGTSDPNHPTLKDYFFGPMTGGAVRPGATPGGTTTGANPLAEKVNFTTEENTTQTERLTAQIIRLNDYIGRGRGGGGGGFQNASFTETGLGGPGLGGGGGGGAASFGGGGYTNLSPGANAAGSSGIPGGGAAAETSSQAVTAAQGGSDLDRGAFDKMFKGTPMEGKYDKVVETAKANNVPPSLMAGIIAHETGRGTSNMLRSRNNPAGLMDPATGMAKGKTFGNLDEGIEAAGRTIAKNYARGGGTIAGMAGIYAPVGAANDPGGLNKSWTSGVSKYSQQLTAPAAGGGTKTASLNPADGTNTSSGTASGGVPSRFSADVLAMTLNGAGPQNIRAYLQSKGVNLSEATCGQFMASVVKDHGGTPPQNPAVASEWNRFGGKEGAGYSDDPNAINIAVKQGARTGATGSHVTTAIPVRDASGNITGFRGVGVNQGKQGVPGLGQYGRDVITSNPISIGDAPGQYHIRHQIPDVDRAALDRPALSKPASEIKSSGSLSVDVKAPAGTKVAYDGDNLLKSTSMQRSTAMQETSSGPSVSDTARSYMGGG